MDIHEYQAKDLLAGFGVPIARGNVAYSADQAVYVATELGGWHWAVKATVAGAVRPVALSYAAPTVKWHKRPRTCWGKLW